MKGKIEIKLLKHLQYGRERLYPNCPLSKAICVIKNKRTMSDNDIGILETLGECEVVVEIVKKRPKVAEKYF